MRKDNTDISDTSSSLLLFAEAKLTNDLHNTARGQLKAQQSQLEHSVDDLLGELSEIKAENGIGMTLPAEA